MNESAIRPKRSRRVVIVALVAVVAVLTLVIYGCVSYAHIVRYTAENGRVTVQAASIKGLGTILVTNKGYPLYMFPPDHRREVSCTGDCASSWPPLIVPAGGSVSSGQGVRDNLIGTVRDAAGDRVVTYHGWPLYMFAADLNPGHANGQAVIADGGPWYVLRPSGRIIRS